MTISPDNGLYAALRSRGISRRSFLKFSAAMAGVLALPVSYGPRIAAAVEAAPRLPVIWLRGAGCGGNTEAFLQASRPTVAELVLDLLSVDYFDALMASSGADAMRALKDGMARHAGGYVLVVEGAVPTADGGATCTIGGRPFAEVAREASAGALATIAVGSCAFDGGLSAAAGGVTGARGVREVTGGGGFISLPGCPLNVENLAATIVHYLTFGEFPATDRSGRPLFAYGSLIHNACERRSHFEFGEFVQAWGDEGAQKGWCLYRMGCKGPQSFANCPTARYAEGASWPIKAGHGCIACTMPGFWDAMGPAYARLPSVLPIGPAVSADQLGAALVGGVGALTVVHGAASYVRARRTGAAGPVATVVEETVAPEPAPGREPGPSSLPTRPDAPSPTPAPATESVVEDAVDAQERIPSLADPAPADALADPAPADALADPAPEGD